MIFNIIILLTANIFIPYVPAPPQLFLLYCGYQYVARQTTIYDEMNLFRTYHNEDFKRSFRESLKKHHPDRGGKLESFARIKAAKNMMQKSINYYDLYNITSIDLASHQPQAQIIEMKELFSKFESAVFYFISLLYFIAFTIDYNLKSLRRVLLLLTLSFAFYDFFIHWYPQQYTIFDMINGQIPIFLQSILLKRIFCIITAIIRTKSIRIKREENIMLDQIENFPLIEPYHGNFSEIKQKDPEFSSEKNNENKTFYLQTLKKLLQIQELKLAQIIKDEKSIRSRIKSWVSKGISILVLGLIIYGAISTNFVQDSDKNFKGQSQF